MATCGSEDPLQTTRLIGRVCKCGNTFSLPVLIGRAAWPQNNSHDPFGCLDLVSSTNFSICLKNKKVKPADIDLKFSVAIAKRRHPFPSRTRKLSSSAPMVLHGRLCGRVGRRRNFFIKTWNQKLIPGFFLFQTTFALYYS
jgi:hypothetical protein